MFSKIFKKADWTDFDRRPKDVFEDARKMIGEQLTEYGYVFMKSKGYLRKNATNGKYAYVIDFTSSRHNRTNVLIVMQVYCRVLDVEENRYISSTALGYLTKKKCFLKGTFNLIKTHPHTIAKKIKKYALPYFENHVPENKY